MKKLLTILMVVALSFVSVKSQAQLGCGLFSAWNSTNLYFVTFGGTPLFLSGTCDIAFFLPGVLLAGDLIRFDINCGNTYNWNTCADTFDTVLRIYEYIFPYPLITYQDDACGPASPFFQSSLTWEATYDGRVWMNVTRWTCVPDFTPYTLFLSCSSTGPCVPLDNDDACDARDLGTIAPFAKITDTFSNLGATVELGEPVPPNGGCFTQTTWCLAVLDNTVWFKFRVTTPGGLRIHSGFDDFPYDTQLALYVGDEFDIFGLLCSFDIVDFGFLNPPAFRANDDGGFVFASLIEDFCTDYSGYHYIQIDGWGGTTGNGNMSVDHLGPSGATDNDDPETATNLGGLSAGGKLTGTFDNTCATPTGIVAPPNGGCNTMTSWCLSVVDNDVWFTFNSTESGDRRLTVFSGFDDFPYDTQLALYTSDDAADYGSFSLVAANDDGGFVGASLISGNRAPMVCEGTPGGSSYYIRVDGWGGAFGSGTVSVEDIGTAIGIPTNDFCSSALDIGAVPAVGDGSLTATFNNECASSSGVVPPIQSCSTGWCDFPTRRADNDLWFSFQAGAEGLIALVEDDLSAGPFWDTQAAIWDDCSGTFRAANDNRIGSDAQISACSGFTVGDTYYLQVDGWSFSFFGSNIINKGPGIITITSVDPPVNDDPAGAIDLTPQYDLVTGGTGSDNFNNECATVTNSALRPPAGSCNSQSTWCLSVVDNDLWWKNTSGWTGKARYHAGFDAFPYDTQLAVWSGPNDEDATNVAASNWNLVAANDDGGFIFASRINAGTQCLIPLVEYYIQVDGWGGTTGDGNLSVTVSGVPVAAACTSLKDEPGPCYQICHIPPGNSGKEHNKGLPVPSFKAHLSHFQAHIDYTGPCVGGHPCGFAKDAASGDVELSAEGMMDVYPNPFSSSTAITFTVPADEAGNVTLEVYNLAGVKVATLFNDKVEANVEYTVEFNSEDLPAGVYINKLTTESGHFYYKRMLSHKE